MALGADLFRGAVGRDRALQVETAPFEPPAMDTRTNPEEMTEEFGRTFARDDFTGGEGLEFAHTRAEKANKESRFYDSFNVNPVGTGLLRGIRLLPYLDELAVLTSSPPRMAYNGTALYLTRSSTSFPTPNVLHKSTDPLAASPTFADDDPHAGEAAVAVQDVAALGTYVYAALGTNGIHRWTGAAWAHWSDIQATRVWDAKSRIIASNGVSLYEAVAGAAPAPLYTLPVGKVWNDVVDAGAAILACASDGNIYAFSPDATTAVLTLRAQTPIEGEEPTALGHAQGIVFYGTREPLSTTGYYTARWWKAELSDSLTLVGGQVLKEWSGDSPDPSPKVIHATRDAVFTVNDAGASACTWRYDLTTGGVCRWVTSSQDGTFTRGGDQVSTGLLSIGGRLFVAYGEGVTNANGGILRESTNYCDEGWLAGPLGDFFSADVKSWVGATIDAEDCSATKTVELRYALLSRYAIGVIPGQFDYSVVILTANPTAAEYPIDAESRYVAGKVILTGPGNATPVVRSFGFRGYPGGGGGTENVDQIMSIPINVSDQLERPNRRLVNIKGIGRRDYERLRAFQGEALTLTLYQSGEQIQYRGLVENVGTPQQMAPERGSSSVFSLLRFRGREVA